MQVNVSRREHAKFIADEVKAGRYPSPEAAVEAAIEQMMVDRDLPELTDADLAAIRESDDQFERGEFVDFDVFAAEMKKKYCGE